MTGKESKPKLQLYYSVQRQKVSTLKENFRPSPLQGRSSLFELSVFEDFEIFTSVPDRTNEISLVSLARELAPAHTRFMAHQSPVRRSSRSAAYRLLKGLTILNAHQIVKNRIDGGAEVIQTAAQDVQPLVQVRIIVGRLRVDVKQTLSVKRSPADEKHYHHRA